MAIGVIDVVTLHLIWSNPIHFCDLFDENAYDDKLEDSGVYYRHGIYMVVGERKIIYIGQTYDQTFKIRLKQHMRSSKWQCISRQMKEVSTTNPFIKCAYLEENYSRKRINEIENLLIFVEEPPCCDKHYVTYKGRRSLELINKGNYWPLKPLYDVEDYLDYI